MSLGDRLAGMGRALAPFVSIIVLLNVLAFPICLIVGGFLIPALSMGELNVLIWAAVAVVLSERLHDFFFTVPTGKLRSPLKVPYFEVVKRELRLQAKRALEDSSSLKFSWLPTSSSVCSASASLTSYVAATSNTGTPPQSARPRRGTQKSESPCTSVCFRSCSARMAGVTCLLFSISWEPWDGRFTGLCDLTRCARGVFTKPDVSWTAMLA